MASRDERRAALALREALTAGVALRRDVERAYVDATLVGRGVVRIPPMTSEGSSVGRAESEAKAETLEVAGSNPAPPTTNDTEETMPKIRYVSAHFHKEVPLLNNGKGIVSSRSTFIDTESPINHGLSIELDTASQVVTVSKGHESYNVPREGVQMFGATVEAAAAARSERARIAAEQRAANEAAAAEAERIAALPA